MTVGTVLVAGVIAAVGGWFKQKGAEYDSMDAWRHSRRVDAVRGAGKHFPRVAAASLAIDLVAIFTGIGGAVVGVLAGVILALWCTAVGYAVRAAVALDG